MTPKDKREPGFWITDNEIIEVYGAMIGPYGLAVYGALAMHAGQRGTCDPSIAAIAREIGASPRKVRSTIGELAAAGVISVEHRPTGKGKNHEPNAYALLPVAKLPKYTGQPTALPAAPTALSAEPLRHDVPNPTALSAYKEEQARTEQEESPDSAPTDAAGDVPTATPDQDAWLPVKVAISTMFGGLTVTDAKGKLKPAVGNTLRIIGKAADDDPAGALAILARFNASKDREYCNRLSALPEAIGSWLGKHPSQAGPMVVSAGGAATLNGHARYAFRTPGGRLAMKAIPVLKSEGLAPDDADPFDRGTWTPAMLEAEAAIRAVAG